MNLFVLRGRITTKNLSSVLRYKLIILIVRKKQAFKLASFSERLLRYDLCAIRDNHRSFLPFWDSCRPEIDFSYPSLRYYFILFSDFSNSFLKSSNLLSLLLSKYKNTMIHPSSSPVVNITIAIKSLISCFWK